MISNLSYDIKAIKKFGLFSHLKYLFDLKHVIINLHFDLYNSRISEGNDLIEIREIMLDDDTDMAVWCEIVNEAFQFNTPYNIESAKKYILNHAYKKINKIYLAYLNNEAVATFFIGHFKNNDNVACAGRFAVKKTAQGKGVGQQIIVEAMNEMKKLGFQYYEETFNFKRDYSIRLFMRCGGFPQFDKKLVLLKPTRKNILILKYAQYKVWKMYLAEKRKISQNLSKSLCPAQS